MNYDELKALIESLGVHPALGPVGQGWGIEQNAHELATFLTKLPPVSRVLEVGTGHNAGLARFMNRHLSWEVASVDVRNYNHADGNVQFIVTSPSKRVKFIEKFDLVIIDGDHSFANVQADHEHYGKLAPIVMFHDIAGLRECEGVEKYWKKISHTQKGNLRKHYSEAIADDDYRAGIGWVCTP